MSSSDDLQTIPARHGTATFVPKGSTIKIVNTSGTQVIDTWAFALPTPPKKKGPQEEPQNDKDKSYQEQDEKERLKLAEEEEKKQEEENKKKEQEEKDKASKKKSNRKSRGSLDLPSQEEAEAATSQQQQLADAESKQQSTPTKSGWTSYLPSLRGRKQITDGNAKEDKKDEGASTEETDKKQDKENSRRWASYLPKGAISAFTAQTDEQHARDPSKSYAEQLADFSRTPVGAASLSVLTGSGSVSSLYAGYSAWNAMNGATAQMEYLSMPHTRASTLHMVPRVNDVLVSNLREPMLTLVEDTSSGVHDTLIPACDPQRYKALQIEDWEQHGSCAENLVLALKELNDRAGLKGPKGVGASVTVNSVPAPLNLFMNIPWKGDKGDLSFEPPTCKEGDYVRLRAERDVVVVMSACPNDVQQINKGQSKDGHFSIENADDSEDEEGPAEVKKVEPKAEKKKPRKLGKKDETEPEDKTKSEKPEEPKKAEKAPLPDTPVVEKSEAASSPAPGSKGKPKDDKPEEQKKAEKVPLPETPATEKSEAASLPAPPKQVKGKPKKLADEAQKKAENTPLPETPATEKSESAASPAPASSSSGQAAPKPKGKPKKLIDSTTGEKKKPRKLESRGKGTATPKSGSAASQQGDATAGTEKNGS
ncbi:hypothetical protein E4T50_12649 [Aureobasidium sp. EXF-12298]|nr:hypothetical protein E4T50_12649 [Aureobasidium sp. EXF-12298]KAI4754447.1 hypothetical protein E4T51_12440 [Aureobasidium sp. EXF-12344]KAI4771594.1 hypothetical protein E4T52_13393 [Aureobasidium sp. EXF-3400]